MPRYERSETFQYIVYNMTMSEISRNHIWIKNLIVGLLASIFHWWSVYELVKYGLRHFDQTASNPNHCQSNQWCSHKWSDIELYLFVSHCHIFSTSPILKFSTSGKFWYFNDSGNSRGYSWASFLEVWMQNLLSNSYLQYSTIPMQYQYSTSVV